MQNTLDFPKLKSVRTEQTTAVIQRFLDELNRADDLPIDPLVRSVLEHSVTRLHWLCELMLERQYPRLMKGPLNITSEELLSGVTERLLKAMRKVRPETVPQFFALANRHIRWELNDFARRLDIEIAASDFHDSQHAAPNSISATAASANARRILDAIEQLSEDEKEVFTLVRIQEMSQVETALLLGISEKTVYRRLKRALVLLHRALHDMQPGPDSPAPGAATASDHEPE